MTHFHLSPGKLLVTLDRMPRPPTAVEVAVEAVAVAVATAAQALTAAHHSRSAAVAEWPFDGLQYRESEATSSVDKIVIITSIA